MTKNFIRPLFQSLCLSAALLICLASIRYAFRPSAGSKAEVVLCGRGVFGFERNVLLPTRLVHGDARLDKLQEGVSMEWLDGAEPWWAVASLDAYTILVGDLESSATRGYGHMGAWAHRIQNPLCVVPPKPVWMLYLGLLSAVIFVVLRAVGRHRITR